MCRCDLRVGLASSILLPAVVAPPGAIAQVLYGRLAARVSDPSGASVAGATVDVRRAATARERQTATSEPGFYNFPLTSPAAGSPNGMSPQASRVRSRDMHRPANVEIRRESDLWPKQEVRRCIRNTCVAQRGSS